MIDDLLNSVPELKIKARLSEDPAVWPLSLSLDAAVKKVHAAAADLKRLQEHVQQQVGR